MEALNNRHRDAAGSLEAPGQHMGSIAKGGGIVFMGRLFAYGGRFALGLLLARFMGVEQFGLYNLAGTLLKALGSMSLLGLGAGVVHYIPAFQQRRDDQGLWGILLTGLTAPFLLGVFAGLAVLMFTTPLGAFFHESRLVSLLPVVAVALPVRAMLSVVVRATYGFKQMQYKVIAEDVVMTAVKLLLIIGLAFIGLNAVKALTVHTIGMVIAVAMMLYFLHHLFPFRSLNKARFHFKLLLGFSFPTYLSQQLTALRTELLIILLGVYSSTAAIGIFAVASRLGVIGNMIHISSITIAAPYISDLYSREQWAQLGRLYQTIARWTFTFSLPLFLLTLLFPRPLLAIFGEPFTSGVTVLVILASANFVNAGTGTCGIMITMTERPWLNTINAVLALITTVVLSNWLIPGKGAVGAAIVQITAVTVVNTARLVQVFVLYRLWPYNRAFAKPIGAAAVALMATYLLQHYLSTVIDRELLRITLSAAVLLLSYALTLLSLGLTAEDYFILSRLGNRLRALVGYTIPTTEAS